jgi:hypothetical protein
MYETAREYIQRIRKPEDARVYFRYNGRDSELCITDFINEYGHKKVDINGDFHDKNGYLMSGCFIHETF